MNAASYPLAIQELLAEERLNDLGPGQPNRAAYPLLQKLTVDNAFSPGKVRDSAMAQACVSGLWLYHDFLEESHRISQDLSGPEGSYWHGLMHRREPDFGNSKYWFRRLGKHPVFIALQQEAAILAGQTTFPEADFLRNQTDWDPFAFIDLCEAATLGRSQSAPLCRQIQRREWELLFDYCCKGAR